MAKDSKNSSRSKRKLVPAQNAATQEVMGKRKSGSTTPEPKKKKLKQLKEPVVMSLNNRLQQKMVRDTHAMKELRKSID